MTKSIEHNNESLENTCIEASQKYLSYSTKKEANNRGYSQDIIDVHSCTPKITEDGQEIFELHLGKSLKSNEFILRDKYHKIEYLAHRDFHVIWYDHSNLIVSLKFNKKNIALDTGTNPNIELSFDLRILIMNQIAVYENHASHIERPQKQAKVETATGLQYVPSFQHPAMPPLNDEQRLAVHTMLTQAFMTTEGPPGAGKTSIISHPVLSYMHAGLPVAIITSTQVALERSLSEIVKICKDVSIDTNRIVKLGHSSTEYAKAHPETLESNEAVNFVKEKREELLLLQIALKYRQIKSKIDEKEEMLITALMLEDLAVSISNLNNSNMQTFARKHLHMMIDMKINSITNSVKTEGLSAIINDMNYLNFAQRHREFLDYKAQMEKHIVTQPISKEEKALIRIKKLNVDMDGDRMKLYEELIGEKYDYLQEEEIQRKISSIKVEIGKFKKAYAHKKLQNAFLIGMTADTYNSRFKQDTLHVHHIFIDEGGYMPLQKVYAMCRRDIPLAIIGDPKQLPPVFEMNDKITKNGEFESTLLYDMSAFYLETLLKKGYAGVKEAYFKSLPPLPAPANVTLDKTYRFGEKLANILNEYVYKNGFSSAIGEDGFVLEYIDAVNASVAQGARVNLEEVNAIHRLIDSGQVGDDYVILTPYKNQVSQLKKQLKGKISPHQVMSIHSSQGQEWDTVILSVVDYMTKGQCTMWFTDSTNIKSKGCEVLNTAVSRAKNRLILVGHQRFWSVQREQLLGKLFQAAQALKV